MKLYRYIRDWGDNGERAIRLLELEVIKESPKTWQVLNDGKLHVIKKDTLRKAFAYPDKERAFKNFKKRTEKALLINEGWVEDAKYFIEEIRKTEKENKTILIKQSEYEIY